MNSGDQAGLSPLKIVPSLPVATRPAESFANDPQSEFVNTMLGSPIELLEQCSMPEAQDQQLLHDPEKPAEPCSLHGEEKLLSPVVLPAWQAGQVETPQLEPASVEQDEHESLLQTNGCSDRALLWLEDNAEWCQKQGEEKLMSLPVWVSQIDRVEPAGDVPLQAVPAIDETHMPLLEAPTTDENVHPLLVQASTAIQDQPVPRFQAVQDELVSLLQIPTGGDLATNHKVLEGENVITGGYQSISDHAAAPSASCKKRKREESEPTLLAAAREKFPSLEVALTADIREKQLTAAAAQSQDYTLPYVCDIEAQKRVEETQKAYWDFISVAQGRNQRKPDMVAFNQLRSAFTPEGVVGHIPGIKIGEKFRGKGELAILGLHCTIAAGIYCKGETAYAIVMSGEYQDDQDHGNGFTYTGMGNHQGGRQVADQEWVRGNLALRKSFQNGQPVRVCRGYPSKDPQNRTPIFSYCGLYKITKATREVGKDGYLVCLFEFVPYPGHSVTSAAPVNFRRATVRLAASPRVGLVAKRSHVKYTRHVLQRDISNGLEDVCIPVCNEYDQDLPPRFTYIRESLVVGNSAVENVIAKAVDVQRRHHPGGCPFESGLIGKKNYLEDGRLMETVEDGVCEVIV
eukprot:jgi/Botrbrau1/3674/Bobra.0008s0006.4